MRTLIIFAVAVVAVAASTAGKAVVCYTVLDGSDRLIYQNSMPPVDMSDQGASSREGFRRRHESLLVSDFDSCPPVAAAPGTTGYRPATVDEIVNGMQGYLSYGGVSSMPGLVGGGSMGGGGGGGVSAAPSASSGSSGGGRGRY